jgi:hypothetical protein
MRSLPTFPRIWCFHFQSRPISRTFKKMVCSEGTGDRDQGPERTNRSKEYWPFIGTFCKARVNMRNNGWDTHVLIDTDSMSSHKADFFPWGRELGKRIRFWKLQYHKSSDKNKKQRYCDSIPEFSVPTRIVEARGSVVGWGTMLQAGR